MVLEDVIWRDKVGGRGASGGGEYHWYWVRGFAGEREGGKAVWCCLTGIDQRGQMLTGGVGFDQRVDWAKWVMGLGWFLDLFLV